MAQRDATNRESAVAISGQSSLLRWLGFVPWAVLALVVFLQAADPGHVFESLRYQIFDFLQRQNPRPYVNTLESHGVQVRYVDIDEDSIRRIGQWPWPRTTVAKLVRNLGQDGAAVVAFDIVFAEPDTTSPDQVAMRLPQDPTFDATRTQLGALPHNDAVLADALKEVTTVTGFAFTDGKSDRKPAFKGSISVLGAGNPALAIGTMPGVTPTLPALEEAAAGNGFFNVVLGRDKDLTVRRVPLLMNYKGQIYPSLTLEVMRALVAKMGQQGTLLIKTPGTSDDYAAGNPNAIVSLRIGAIPVPLNENGELWLHYTNSVPERRIPAWKVLDGSADKHLLESAAVFVGTSAPGLVDLRPTPMSAATPGVEIHVQALEQMLLGYSLLRPDFAFGMELFYATILGLLILIAIVRVPVVWIGIIAVAGIVFALGLSWYAFVSWHWLLDPISPSLNVAFVFIAAGLVKFIRTDTERQMVRSAFAQYLPPDVVNDIANDPSKLKLGGATRDLTIMFCDIRGFTPIAESFRDDPQGLTKLINRALTPLSQEVLNHRGTIDKYIGDCVMAFWNAPLDDADHPTHGCDCALGMMDAMSALNRELKAEGFFKTHKVKPIEVSIGLNTGTCVVGNMGSELRFDYSALGDAVNVAARIQSFAGNYGFDMVIGEDTEQLIREKFAFLELDYLAVKGRATPTHIYALMGHAHVRETKKFIQLQEALQALFAAFRSKDWAAAREAIDAGRPIAGEHQDIFDTYEERIAHFELEPPPANWDGAWVATSK